MTQSEFMYITQTKKNIFDALSELFKKLVPASGKADTVAGEVVRALNRIIYRFKNDGDVFYEGYGLETVAPSLQYILDIVKKYDSEFYNYISNKLDTLLFDLEYVTEDEYEDFLIGLSDACLTILSEENNENLFEDKSNKTDSRYYDASYFETNQKKYDVELTIDSEIKDTFPDLDDNTIKHYILDYVEDSIASEFGNSRLSEIDINVNMQNRLVYISNITREEADTINEWENSGTFWDYLLDIISENYLDEELETKHKELKESHSDEEHECCLCHKKFKGYGNNPYPLVKDPEAKCCDDCNLDKVIPARLASLSKPDIKEDLETGKEVSTTIKIEPNIIRDQDAISSYRRLAHLPDDFEITMDNINPRALQKCSCYCNYDINDLKEMLIESCKKGE